MRRKGSMKPVPAGCCWVAKKSAPLISPLAFGPVVRSTIVALAAVPAARNAVATSRAASDRNVLRFIMCAWLDFYDSHKHHKSLPASIVIFYPAYFGTTRSCLAHASPIQQAKFISRCVLNSSLTATADESLARALCRSCDARE